MAEIKFGEILENACRLAGRDPTLCQVPTGWKVLASMTLNTGLRAIAAEKFPFMTRVEFRYYRPEWQSTISYQRGMEVYYSGEYFRFDGTRIGIPGQIGNDWTLLKMEELCAFINWEQPWENTVIDNGSVDINRFAFESDPRYNPHAMPLKVVGMSELGIELQSPAPKVGVFCKFTPVFPRVVFDEWATGELYKTGDVVYMTASKDVYQCCEDIEAQHSSTAPSADSGEFWAPIRIRDEFASYLTRLVASDLLTEDQGKYQTKATAAAELDDLVARYHEGNGENLTRSGRFI